MNHGLYQGAAAMRASDKRLEVIAHNLANVDTHAYKRQGTAAHSFQVKTVDGPKQGLRTELSSDWSQGNLDRTGNPYDLALFGGGFFAVDGPRGEVYTRAGSFQVDPEGVLVSADGHPLAWEKKYGVIDPAGVPVVIGTDGVVAQGQREVGRLRIVDFADRNRLAQNAEGYYEAPPGARRRAHTAEVHQGALERSNAVGLEEVVALVTVQRAFEAAANVMSMIDDSYQRLTRSGS
jgi:flagellar basal body rod protein FlgG